MRETQRNTFNRRVGDLLIASALVLLGIVFVVRFPSPSPPVPEPAPVKKTPHSLPHLGEQPDILSRAPLQSSDLPPYPSDFYRTIIDNNLFRPLGWTPLRPVEPYRLLGTILSTDEKTPPQAILQSTAGNQTHIVSIGSTLDAATKIVDIQPKQVTLDRRGQQRILKLEASLWMNAVKGRSSHRR